MAWRRDDFAVRGRAVVAGCYDHGRAGRGGKDVKLRQAMALLVALVGTILLLLGTGASAGGGAIVIEVKGAIGPASRDFIRQGLERARTDGAEVLIIQLDTPGGLDSSMRDIIQDILQSPVPVATWVAPEGGRAASAGTYILYASHVAAMAPATTLGAATPVAIGGAPGGEPERPRERPADDAEDASSSDPANGEAGAEDTSGDADANEGTEPAAGAADDTAEPRARDRLRQPRGNGTAQERKAVEDAVAYIRSLAEKRGRNADWAESAVRDAASLSSSEALEQNVIDLIAISVGDLLTQMDGRVVEVAGEDRTLATSGLAVTRIEPDWRTRLLAVITDPTVAYLLMLVGIYGLLLEGYNPGALVPGVVGGISLLLALFAFQILPVNYAGLALILLGVALIVAETFVPSFGILGIGGVAAFTAGSVILMDSDIPGFGISLPLIISIAGASGLVMLGIALLAARNRYSPVVSGSEEMVGAMGEALEDFEGRGPVWVHAERWTVVVDGAVRKGQTVRITAVEGLHLVGEPVETRR
ncbi:MAG: nodulation protein NfeD [Gammaproteobacteria bacterium]|nr:MAG: nodulation protein NfeD [Gammaproteobacteria bacterium]